MNDVSSEMMFPLLPLFLTSVLGAGPAFLGLVEGLADSVASVTKLAAGALADRIRRRKRLIGLGYALAVAARLLIAGAVVPWHVLVLRVGDRLGKGARTAPRDALIAESIDPGEAGRAYGFHRAMDHLGAALGPLLALALLGGAGIGLRALFALAALPGLAALAIVALGVHDPARGGVPPSSGAPREPVRRGPVPGPQFRRFLAIMALFTLGNSSDAFLLLRATDVGLPASVVPLLWFLLHAAKSASATPGGALSDRLGRGTVIACGWALYVAVYLGLGFASTGWQVVVLFAAYGAYFGLTEGPLAALVAEMAPSRRATGFGLYHATVGLATLPASLLMGALWERFGAATAFTVSAVLAAAALLMLLASRLGDGPGRSR